LLTEAPQSRVQGRPRRLGLYGPFVALAIALVAWGGGWLSMKSEIERSLDATAVRLKAAGGTLTWSRRLIYGYPFRFDVDLTGLVWRGPDGWGLSTPELKSESSMFALGRWVGYAPAGATLIRPEGGDVQISASLLRASLSAMGAHPPTFSLEGQSLSFTPAPGAAPFLIASLSGLHVHIRAGPSDQGAAYVELDDARSPGTGPADWSLDLTYDHADSLSGLDWNAAHHAWSAAGGKVELNHLHFRNGAMMREERSDQFAADSDGRVRELIARTLLTALEPPPHRRGP
jgi:hypothetical protein